MTSTTRVSDLKDEKRRGKKNNDGKPREGTKLREAYDALRRGEVVNMQKLSCSNAASQLRDFYGMELCIVRELGVRGSVGSRLVGEWDGPYFVPLESIVQDEDVVEDRS